MKDQDTTKMFRQTGPRVPMLDGIAGVEPPPAALFHPRLGEFAMGQSIKMKKADRKRIEAAYEKRDKALDRLVAAWVNHVTNAGDPKAKALDAAINALAAAHVNAKMES